MELYTSEAGSLTRVTRALINRPPPTSVCLRLSLKLFLHLSLQIFLHIVPTEVCHDTSDTGANQQPSTHLTLSPPPNCPPSLHQYLFLVHAIRLLTRVLEWHELFQQFSTHLRHCQSPPFPSTKGSFSKVFTSSLKLQSSPNHPQSQHLTEILERKKSMFLGHAISSV